MNTRLGRAGEAAGLQRRTRGGTEQEAVAWGCGGKDWSYSEKRRRTRIIRTAVADSFVSDIESFCPKGCCCT